MVDIAERLDEVAREGDVVGHRLVGLVGIEEVAGKIRTPAIGAGRHPDVVRVQERLQRQRLVQPVDDVLAERLDAGEAQLLAHLHRRLEIGLPTDGAEGIAEGQGLGLRRQCNRGGGSGGRHQEMAA